jgi:hypothetical protein
MTGRALCRGYSHACGGRCRPGGRSSTIRRTAARSTFRRPGPSPGRGPCITPRQSRRRLTPQPPLRLQRALSVPSSWKLPCSSQRACAQALAPCPPERPSTLELSVRKSAPPQSTPRNSSSLRARALLHRPVQSEMSPCASHSPPCLPRTRAALWGYGCSVGPMQLCGVLGKPRCVARFACRRQVPTGQPTPQATLHSSDKCLCVRIHGSQSVTQDIITARPLRADAAAGDAHSSCKAVARGAQRVWAVGVVSHSQCSVAGALRSSLLWACAQVRMSALPTRWCSS